MLFASRGRKVGPAIFDRRHRRLTQGLVGYWSAALTGPTGMQLLDLSGQNNHCTLQNMDAPTDWVLDQPGTVLDLDATNDFFELSRSIDFPALYSCTISLWFRPTQWIGANPGIIRSGTSAANSATGGDFFILQGSTGLPFIRRNGNDILRPSSGSGFTLNNWQHCLMNSSPNSTECYRNGVLIHSATHSITGTAFSFWRWGFQGAISTPEKLCGQVAEFAVWNRFVTGSEPMELFRLGPGGLGHPARLNVGIFEATIAFSIIADTGSYTLSGLPIPLLCGRSIAADAASILLQGQTTPLRLSRLLSADPRSYQFSGVDAGILLGRLLDAGAAAYTVDGTSAGFLANRRISAESVAYLASGQDAAFLRSRVIQAGTGQYILVASPIDIQTGTGGAAPYYYLFLLGGSR